MSRREKDAKAQALRAEGLTYKQISKRMGESTSQAWRRCNREEFRAKERTRNAYKRAHEHAKRSVCPRCGERMGAGTGSPSHARGRVCRGCFESLEEERLRSRDRVLERLWASGASLTEIASSLGWSRGHLGQEMFRARKRGADLPYRKYGDKHGQISDLRRAA